MNGGSNQLRTNRYQKHVSPRHHLQKPNPPPGVQRKQYPLASYPGNYGGADRYTPTPRPGATPSRTRIQLESSDFNWTLKEADENLQNVSRNGMERGSHSPDSLFTLSSGSSHSYPYQYGAYPPGEAPGSQPLSSYRRSQSIPDLRQLMEEEVGRSRVSSMDHSSDGVQRSSSLRRSRQTTGEVQEGSFVKVKVGDFKDYDAVGYGSERLAKGKYKSESNLVELETEGNYLRWNDERVGVPIPVRTVTMRKSKGMFGFVLNCKPIYEDPRVPDTLRFFPHVESVVENSIAEAAGLHCGDYILEISGQNVNRGSFDRCNYLMQLGGNCLQLKVASLGRAKTNVGNRAPVQSTFAYQHSARQNPFPPRTPVGHRTSMVRRCDESRRRQATATPQLKKATSSPNLAAEMDDSQAHIYEELVEPIPDQSLFRSSELPEVGQSIRLGRNLSRTPGGAVVMAHNGNGSSSKNRTGLRNNSTSDATTGSSSPPPPPPRSNQPDGSLDKTKTGLVQIKIEKEEFPDVLAISTSGVAKTGIVNTSSGVSSSFVDLPKTSSLGETENRVKGIQVLPKSWNKSKELEQVQGPITFISVPGASSNSAKTPGIDSRNAADKIPALISPGDRTPVLMQSRDNIPALISPRDRLPGQIQYSDKTPVLISPGDRTPAPIPPGDRTVVPNPPGGRKPVLIPPGTKGKPPVAGAAAASNRATAAESSIAQGMQKRDELRTDLRHQNELKIMTSEEEEIDRPSIFLTAIRSHPLLRKRQETPAGENSNPSLQNSRDHVPVRPSITTPQHAAQQRLPPAPFPKRKPPAPSRSVSNDALETQELDRDGRFQARRSSDTTEFPQNQAKTINPRLLKPSKADPSKSTISKKSSDDSVKVSFEESVNREENGVKKGSQPNLPTSQAGKSQSANEKLQAKDDAVKDLQDVRYKCFPRATHGNRTRGNLKTTFPGVLPDVLELDGATTDQSYSEDQPKDTQKVVNDGALHPNDTVHLTLDNTTGKMLLSDATVDQSSTDISSTSILPPPLEFALTEVPSNMVATMANSNSVPGKTTLHSTSPLNLKDKGSNRHFSREMESSVPGKEMLAFSDLIPPPPVFFNSENVHPESKEGIPTSSEDRSLSYGKINKPRRSRAMHPEHGLETGTKIPPSQEFSPLLLPPMEFQQSVSGTVHNSGEMWSTESKPAADRRIPNLSGRSMTSGNQKRDPVPPSNVLNPSEDHTASKSSNYSDKQQPSEIPTDPSRTSKTSGLSAKDWSCSDVSNWLRSIGQERHAGAFSSKMVDGRKLLVLTRKELIDLGVKDLEHRRDIERGVLRLKQSTTG